MDSGLWKKTVLDSNVAAQQEGITALCAFLQYGGVNACLRYMNPRLSFYTRGISKLTVVCFIVL